jgi:hypothetical protein
MIFRGTMLLLILAVAGAPTAADYCMVSCETAHARDAGSAAHAAHHHHRSTILVSIAQSPQPCGHDHNGIVAVTASSDVAPAPPLMAASAALPAASPLMASPWTQIFDVHGSNSPPGTTLRGFASPLRV